MLHENVCAEQESSKDIEGQDSWGIIHMNESIYRTFDDLWLFIIHPCACGEEDEVGTFRTKKYTCGVERDFKGIHYLHSITEEDKCES
jgi:hypothetical protein